MELHYVEQPRWGDLDVNQHVNNVKYIGWILEVVSSGPAAFFSSYSMVTDLAMW
jgi:acyl-ACP thioesterase